MKSFIVFLCWMLLAYAAFASIILAGLLIAPEASMVVFGIEFIAFIKGMDCMYEKKRNKKAELKQAQSREFITPNKCAVVR